MEESFTIWEPGLPRNFLSAFTAVPAKVLSKQQVSLP